MSKTMKLDAIANDPSCNMAPLPKRVTDIAAYVQIAFLNDKERPVMLPCEVRDDRTRS